MTTQQDCSIGLKKETTYGTYATPDLFLEHTSETLQSNLTRVQGKGMRPGSRAPRAARRVTTKIDAGGTVELEVPSTGFGTILEALLGTVTNTEVPTDTDVWQQVHTPKTSDYLESYTIQKGIPPLGGGTTHAFTFLGAQCASLELKASAGEILVATSEWIAREMVRTESYAAPSYPTVLDLFAFNHGGIYVGNTVTKATTTALASATGNALANIRDFSLKISNGLDANGFNLGGGGKRTRKAATGMLDITGTLTAEYDSTDLLDAYLDDEDLTFLLEFELPRELDTGIYATLQVHIPLIRLDGEIPKSNGGDVITQSIPFVGLDSLAASTAHIYAVYRSTDTAP
jgi:hypothetical protein